MVGGQRFLALNSALFGLKFDYLFAIKHLQKLVLVNFTRNLVRKPVRKATPTKRSRTQSELKEVGQRTQSCHMQQGIAPVQRRPQGT